MKNHAEIFIEPAWLARLMADAEAVRAVLTAHPRQTPMNTGQILDQAKVARPDISDTRVAEALTKLVLVDKLVGVEKVGKTWGFFLPGRSKTSDQDQVSEARA